MLAKVGALALSVLVGAETFAMAAAILWPLAAITGLGVDGRTAALVVAGLLGAGAAIWIGRRAARSTRQTSSDDRR